MDAAEGKKDGRMLFQNFCCRAEGLEDGTVSVIHVRHDGRFCGLQAMARALDGKLDFDTRFTEIEGDFFTG